MSEKRTPKFVALALAVALMTGCTGSPQLPEISLPQIPVFQETEPEKVRTWPEKPQASEAEPAQEQETLESTFRLEPECLQTFSYEYCIHNDGTVSFRDDDNVYVKVTDPAWRDVVAVVPYIEGGTALRADGTVVTMNPGSEGSQIMSQWQDIVHIHSYGDYGGIVGLRADGRVFSAEDNPVITQWRDIVQLVDGYYGLFGLKADGTVVSENTDVDLSGWTGVVRLAEGQGFLAGLRSDGTVLYSGYDEKMAQEISSWTNVVKLSAYNDLMGLRADGTVVATQSFFDFMGMDMEIPMNYSEWTNVVDICAWGASYLGLRSDGTVLAAGLNEGGQLNVTGWRNIQAAVISYYSTFGLTEDGVLLQTVEEYDTESDGIVAFDVRCPGE